MLRPPSARGRTAAPPATSLLAAALLATALFATALFAPAAPAQAAARVPFAPYVDASLYPPFPLASVAKKTGVRQFTLAFVLSGGGCAPTWGGVAGPNAVAKKIGALRKLGGDVRVSFGGAAGSELALACGSVPALTAAYEKVVRAYKLTKADFDVEGAALPDAAANDRRAKAVRALQKKHPKLDVSFTLPVLPSGLTADGVAFLRNLKKNKVRVGAINIMAMDYGDGAAPAPKGRMGDYAIKAARSAQKQIRKVFKVSDATAWRHLAVTPMIGVNDVASEVFTTADARKLRAFARQKRFAWLSMWSAARDRACPGGPKAYADPACSSIAQAPYAFMRALR
ncbi:chitinase [Actinocorallia longicatena]|uniref:Chitinase n=1 Tax=Actinocorallia longicatena TaxID=111803 RepID=A0ABP6Q0Z2_9ACTN